MGSKQKHEEGKMQGNCGGERGEAKLGEAWAMLGLLRLRLVSPAAGVDPALEPALQRDGILILNRSLLKPELQVLLLEFIPHQQS